MTGFGFAEQNHEDYSIAVEIKSYNNRFLDINIILPPYLNQLEERIRQEIGEKVKRGRIELFLKIKFFNEDIQIIIEKKRLQAHVKALQELITLAGLDEELHLSHLLRMEGLLKTYQSYDYEKYWKVIKPVIDKALKSVIQSRSSEGEKLKKDILSMVEKIQTEIQKIERSVPDIEKKIMENVKQKFAEILGDSVDDTRVLSEIALLLIKFDINEEIVRMKTHTENIINSISEEEVVGKKLDFLCQELNREINTVSAKSLLININNSAIIVKESIERIREQLRNVE
jgi:uncharacterized protein (TIGR00255 family)